MSIDEITSNVKYRKDVQFQNLTILIFIILRIC